jgi:hypothetical protein
MGNRYYPIGDKELASVTTITGLADKSDALIPWAVNCAVDFIKMRTWIPSKVEGFLAITDAELEDARTKWREVRDEAGDIGTQVHDALEAWLNETKAVRESVELDCGNEQANKLFEAAKAKINELGNFTVLATEQKVVNEDEWYAGRFDALLEVGGETWLIDFKTGASFYPEWGMQLAAYADAQELRCPKECPIYEKCKEGHICAYPHLEPQKVDRIKVLRLDKKTLKAHWKEYGGEKDTLTRDDYMTAFRGLRDAFYTLKAKKAVKQAWLGR